MKRKINKKKFLLRKSKHPKKNFKVFLDESYNLSRNSEAREIFDMLKNYNRKSLVMTQFVS